MYGKNITSEKCFWIGRSLIVSPYSISLCLSEDSFRHEMKRLKVPVSSWPKWIIEGYGGTTHTLEENEKHEMALVICIKKEKSSTRDAVIGLIVHEAVHVWQKVRDNLREEFPSTEFEAYSIQQITVNLIDAYNQLTKKKK